MSERRPRNRCKIDGAVARLGLEPRTVRNMAAVEGFQAQQNSPTPGPLTLTNWTPLVRRRAGGRVKTAEGPDGLLLAGRCPLGQDSSRGPRLPLVTSHRRSKSCAR